MPRLEPTSILEYYSQPKASIQLARSTQNGVALGGVQNPTHPAEPIVASNHPVGYRSHVNYWADREVLKIIRDHVFEPSETPETKPSARAA